MSEALDFDVVIPTVGRRSLRGVLDAVLFGSGPPPRLVVVVDDRPAGRNREPVDLRARSQCAVTLRRSFGAGPAAARNVGWLAGSSEWVVFLDDDVVPPHDWRARLADDLSAAAPTQMGSQGNVRVPLPGGRRPTDWERNVAALQGARGITADLACRRAALERVGGFDERFRSAYREDSDLVLQIADRAGPVAWGTRHVDHPIGDATWSVSVRRQRGNEDDALMRRRYGPAWREASDARRTRLPVHVATTALAALAVIAAAGRHRRLGGSAAALWAAATLQFFAMRARTGPRTPSELASLAVTSALIPPVAVAHRIRGELRVLREARAGLPPSARLGPRRRPRAVLFDRDGTLVLNVPYNGDPDAVVPVDGAGAALATLREAGVRVAVVTNQSAIGRGLVTPADVDAVHRRIEAQVGPIEQWLVCPHTERERCGCRKPSPGLVLAAATRLRVLPSQCVVIGDTEADVAAARRAGARGILVPNPATRHHEVAVAPETAPTLAAAVELLLGAA